MTSSTPKRSSSEISKGWYSLSGLKSLHRELNRLDSNSRDLVLALILRCGIERTSEYISETGKKGMTILVNAARLISDDKIVNFRNASALENNFRYNQEELGEAWYGKKRSLGDKQEYLTILRKIISDIHSYRIAWSAPGFKIRPKLGYLYKASRPILVVIGENGFIERGQALGNNVNWSDVVTEMDNFYKIDNFSDSMFD